MVSDDDQMIRGDGVDGGQMGVGWTRCERLGTPGVSHIALVS